MIFKTGINRSASAIKGVIICILIIIGTFPENDWSYSIGIDPPLAWVFNTLYTKGLIYGKQIVFPHGPLAFFLYPLQENIWFVTIVTSIIKSLLVINVYFLLDGSKENFKWILSFIVAYFISIISGFNHIIIANAILLYCNYYIYEKNEYKLIAFFLTAFAFYIKSDIAIILIILYFSFLLYYFFKFKNFKKAIIDVLCLTAFMLIFWLVMYGTFLGFINYITGMIQLAKENSTAASYYPDNNWWVLSIFFAIILSIPFINRTKKSYFYGILILLSLFAVWKYGISREDIFHYRAFLIFVIISSVVFVLFHQQNFFKNSILLVCAIFLLIINMNYAIENPSLKTEICRINNFFEFITNFSEIKSKSILEIQKNTSQNKLPQEVLDSIKNATVDVYPWDYSIIAINNLNWQPRIIIHSYASYTSWLDQKNADHFKSNKAPDYLIIEKIPGMNGGNFNSLDYRYLFNDEPKTIVEIIRKYSFYYSDNKFLILKKTGKVLKTNYTCLGIINSGFGKWMDVPRDTGVLIRAKLKYEKSFLQSLKSFFYKDEQFWIYLKNQNGIVHKYRIVPKNARDGIWINPYYIDTEQKYSIQQIMVKCSNQKIINNCFTIEWEKIEFEKKPECVKDFLSFNLNNKDTILRSSINTFDVSIDTSWKRTSESLILNFAFEGEKSEIVKPNSYSSTFSYPLDSLLFGDFFFNADLWVSSPDYKYSKNTILVISVDDNNGSLVWKGLPIDDQLIDRKQWNNIFSQINYYHHKPNCILKIYVWNSGDNNIHIDNFRVIMYKKHL